MRCRYCGSKAIYPYKNHEQAGAGRVIAGAIIAGTVGAIAGLAGKNVNGYRCSACGMFSELPMDSGEEALLNYEISNARNGNARIYERYKEKYANLEFVPVRQEVKQELYQLPVEHYENASAQLPVAERAQESVKHSYSPNQYIVGSPIFISNITIQDDNGTDVLLLDINNISDKTLRSVYLNVTVYDDVGDQISTSTFALQGLSVASGETLPQAKPFNLNTNVAYKVDVTCEKAAFTDDSVWRKEENQTIYSVPEKTELVPESFAQYKYLQVLLAKKGALRVGQKLYYPVIEETLRLCICGNPAVSGSKCAVCGLDEADLQEVMDYDVLVQCRRDLIVRTAKERTNALRNLYQQAQEDRYQEALQFQKKENFTAATRIFTSLAGYKDSQKQAEQCEVQAEECRKQRTYDNGITLMLKRFPRIEDYKHAIVEFKKISGWKDADTQIEICQKKIEEIVVKEEADRIERERKAEIARTEDAARAKRNKKITAIAVAAVCAVIVFFIILITVIIPNSKYNNAMALMEAGKYNEAITAFEAIDSYKDSRDRIKECTTAILDSKYTDAVVLMDAGKYTEAISAFEALDGYKDSKNKIKECNTAILDGKYNDAVALMNAGKYNEAIVAFTALNGYKDSTKQIANCNTAINDINYHKAVALIDTNVIQAYEALVALNGYKDSAEKASSIYGKYMVQKAQVGSYIFFGAYEQDNQTSNGKEDIEWLILAKEGSKVLVISKYALDCQQYHTNLKDVTWETCTLRQWLNNYFINSAFSVNEQVAIPTVTVSADANPHAVTGTTVGNATRDKIFLLSIVEAERYFSSDSAMQCIPSSYAKAQGAFNWNSSGTCSWWLRTTGSFQETAAIVITGGRILEQGDEVDEDINGVRPALWIDLSKIS